MNDLSTLDLSTLSVAIVHEWFVSYAGSEKVVEQLLRVFPQADVFCLVDFLEDGDRQSIGLTRTHTSFIQSLPGSQRRFRSYLPLMPLAIEQFDLDGYDLVISSSHAVAKGVLTRPDQLHISYVHTPIRYGWELQHQYLRQANLTHGLKSAFVRVVLHYLRLWDVLSANRVDVFVANSAFIASRIRNTYRRSAHVIYPPVAVHRFEPIASREAFYLSVCRFVPYKRLDVVIEAFTSLTLPLVLIGDGEERPRLQALAGANITFLGYQSDVVVKDYMQRCKAFIYAAEEDFGITLIEAQAAGAPVIAYNRGGASETVLNDTTGILFSEQTANSLVNAVKAFEAGQYTFDEQTIRSNAQNYTNDRFRQEFQQFTLKILGEFRRGDALE